MKNDTIAFAKAIADPTRQAMMKELCCEWLCTNDLVERIGVSQPTISHHCSILNDAGLLIKQRKGKHVFCTLDQERVTQCCGQLIEIFAPELAPSRVNVADIAVAIN